MIVARETLAWGVIGLEACTTSQLIELQMQSVEEKDVLDYNTVFGLLVGRINWSYVIIMQMFKITFKVTMEATHCLLQLTICLPLLTLLGVLNSVCILEKSFILVHIL